MGLGHALVVATNLVPKQMWRCMLRVDTSVCEGFSCPTFQLLCPNRKSLRNHMTRKHSQNPKKPQLSVNFCWWRNFFSLELDCLVNSKMNKYSEGHGSGTVWRCTDCGYKSKYKTNVSEHVESRHVQLTWAVCNYCSSVCVNREALRNHVTEMKASKTESLTELPLESCPKSCFSSLFFFRTGELHCLKNVQVDIEQKGRFAETWWRCNGPRGAKISILDQNYPFSLAEVLFAVVSPLLCQRQPSP